MNIKNIFTENKLNQSNLVIFIAQIIALACLITIIGAIAFGILV